MARRFVITFLFVFNFLYAGHEEMVVVTNKWEPFTMVANGKLKGIGIDFWKLVAKKAGIKYKFKIVDKWSKVLESIKEGNASLTVSTGMTEDREDYAVFSKPYVTYPLVLATKNDIGFIFDINFLRNKKIAIGKCYTAEKLMMKKYPFLKYVYTESVDEALDLVKNGEVFAAVDILPVIAYKINRYEYYNLKISGQIPINFNVRFMISKKHGYLLEKINKAIDSISFSEKEKIYGKYISPVKKVVFSSNELLFYFLIFFSFVIIILLWIYSLKIELLTLKRDPTDYNADCDRLTGLFSRKKIEDIIFQKQKNEEKFSVIMFDINEFKNINRFYGHHFGDIALLELVSVVKSSLKKEDVLGRYAGGTFVIITHDADGVCEYAEKIYELIRGFEFSTVNRLECSFAVYKNAENKEDVLKNIYKTLRENKNKNLKFTC
ncbi:transporter substrate-binding domain-containing diguanylate cyclase [Nautilia sp.]